MILSNTILNKKISLVLVFIFISAAAVYAIGSNLKVSITIPEEYQVIHPGGKVILLTNVANQAFKVRQDIHLDFFIKDSQENVIKKWKKAIAIETKLSLIEEFILPEKAEEGIYEVELKVSTLDGKESSIASHSFEVEKVSFKDKNLVQNILIGSVSFLFVGLIYEHRRISKLKISGKHVKKMVRYK